jgi:hypothetical protein
MANSECSLRSKNQGVLTKKEFHPNVEHQCLKIRMMWQIPASQALPPEYRCGKIEPG